MLESEPSKNSGDGTPGELSQMHYQMLVQHSSRLVSQSQIYGLSEFIAFTECLFQSTGISASEIERWLAQTNRQVDWVPVEMLVKDWIPVTLNSRKGEIVWCLPIGRATQPFYDEYISSCRQHIVNTLVTPRTSVRSLLNYAQSLQDLTIPVGLIFHLSRCGSTLVSSSAAAIERCSVLSESPLLTEILLSTELNQSERKALLRLCVHLQGRASQKQPHVVVKWNAWDLFCWDLIYDSFPAVPALFLTREPVEILASHERSVGRHMSGDSTLIALDRVFDGQNFLSLLGFRIQVLRKLINQMLERKGSSNVFFLDYCDMDASRMQEVFEFFGMPVYSRESALFKQHFLHNSKQPDQYFIPDSKAKRSWLGADEVRQIKCNLQQDYHNLIASLTQ